MITPEQIRQLRGILCLTQKELAERLGVSIKTVANYEGGGVIPSAKQKLLIDMLNNAQNHISQNVGSINTGSVGGHNITISDPGIKKIIEKDKVEIERNISVENYLQTIKRLEARILDLERIIKAKDDLISVLQEKR